MDNAGPARPVHGSQRTRRKAAVPPTQKAVQQGERDQDQRLAVNNQDTRGISDVEDDEQDPLYPVRLAKALSAEFFDCEYRLCSGKEFALKYSQITGFGILRCNGCRRWQLPKAIPENTQVKERECLGPVCWDTLQLKLSVGEPEGRNGNREHTGTGTSVSVRGLKQLRKTTEHIERKLSHGMVQRVCTACLEVTYELGEELRGVLPPPRGRRLRSASRSRSREGRKSKSSDRSKSGGSSRSRDGSKGRDRSKSRDRSKETVRPEDSAGGFGLSSLTGFFKSSKPTPEPVSSEKVYVSGPREDGNGSKSSEGHSVDVRSGKQSKDPSPSRSSHSTHEFSMRELCRSLICKRNSPGAAMEQNSAQASSEVRNLARIKTSNLITVSSEDRDTRRTASTLRAQPYMVSAGPRIPNPPVELPPPVALPLPVELPPPVAPPLPVELPPPVELSPPVELPSSDPEVIAKQLYNKAIESSIPLQHIGLIPIKSIRAEEGTKVAIWSGPGEIPKAACKWIASIIAADQVGLEVYKILQKRLEDEKNQPMAKSQAPVVVNTEKPSDEETSPTDYIPSRQSEQHLRAVSPRQTRREGSPRPPSRGRPTLR